MGSSAASIVTIRTRRRSRWEWWLIRWVRVLRTLIDQLADRLEA